MTEKKKNALFYNLFKDLWQQDWHSLMTNNGELSLDWPSSNDHYVSLSKDCLWIKQHYNISNSKPMLSKKSQGSQIMEMCRTCIQHDLQTKNNLPVVFLWRNMFVPINGESLMKGRKENCLYTKWQSKEKKNWAITFAHSPSQLINHTKTRGS